MNFSPEERIVRAPDLMVAPVGEELAMFSADAGKYYALNEIATDIWQRLEHPLSVAGLCEELQQVFQVSPAQCLEDVSYFLGELYSRGLIRIVPSSIDKEE